MHAWADERDLQGNASDAVDAILDRPARIGKGS
jgi:hypothetical protein